MCVCVRELVGWAEDARHCKVLPLLFQHCTSRGRARVECAVHFSSMPPVRHPFSRHILTHTVTRRGKRRRILFQNFSLFLFTALCNRSTAVLLERGCWWRVFGLSSEPISYKPLVNLFAWSFRPTAWFLFSLSGCSSSVGKGNHKSPVRSCRYYYYSVRGFGPRKPRVCVVWQ